MKVQLGNVVLVTISFKGGPKSSSLPYLTTLYFASSFNFCDSVLCVYSWFIVYLIDCSFKCVSVLFRYLATNYLAGLLFTLVQL